MADPLHLHILGRGVAVWNEWRRANPAVRPDLRDASFRAASPGMLGIDLGGANFRGADLRGADLYRAWLVGADFTRASLDHAVLGEATAGGATFRHASLRETNFMKAHLFEADFTGARFGGTRLFGSYLERARLAGCLLAGEWLESADLREALLAGADLRGANLKGANFEGADLTDAKLANADLRGARLVGTNVEGTDFGSASVHGISVWGTRGTPANEQALRISNEDEAEVTVDSLDMAQFIYLLLDRRNLRTVLETMTARAALILGRFTPDRKFVLEAMAAELRRHGLLPIIFDFERVRSRDLTETVKILAGLSLFVIADISNPRSSPLELQATVPDYRVPFVVIIQEGEEPFAMADDLARYDWVVQPFLTYPSAAVLQQTFKAAILDRAMDKQRQLLSRSTATGTMQSVADFLFTAADADRPAVTSEGDQTVGA